MTYRNLNCKTRPVQRAAGQSAVVGAAYRAGERLFDERRERTADFSRRAPDVRETLILAPDGAPDWTQDRGQLWNAAEAAEKRKDGRPARDVQLGLAWELSPEEQKAAVIEFARREFISKGHVADVAFHSYGQRVSDVSDEGRATLRRWAEQEIPFLERDECDGWNEPHVKIERSGDGTVQGYKVYQPHAHLFVTPRALDGDSFAAKRNRDLDRAETAMHWRYEWPRIQNEYLARAGEEIRVTATRRTEDGPLRDETVQGVARTMELRGEPTRARDAAAFAEVHNQAIRQAMAESAPADAQEEPDTSEPIMAPDREPDVFAVMHAASIRQAAADTVEQPEAAGQSRRERIAEWWQNMNHSFSEWRGHVAERASETWQRFRNGPEPPQEEPEPEHEPD